MRLRTAVCAASLVLWASPLLGDADAPAEPAPASAASAAKMAQDERAQETGFWSGVSGAFAGAGRAGRDAALWTAHQLGGLLAAMGSLFGGDPAGDEVAEAALDAQPASWLPARLQACQLLSTDELYRALGEPVTGTRSMTDAMCRFRLTAAEVDVTLVPPAGVDNRDAFRGERSEAGEAGVELHGLADAAYGVEELESARVTFLQGNTLVRLRVASPSAAPAALDAAEALAHAAARRLTAAGQPAALPADAFR